MTEQCSKEPLMVTIRCITYNHEPYIRQCLEGFVMQKTNFRFEAIVHDDASTDGTADIIREFADKYPGIIKPIFETENQYSKHDGSIRRIMDAHTHGKYVAICEGDDYWTDPLKLQKQVDFMEGHPDHSLCGTNGIIKFQGYAKKERLFNQIKKSKELFPKDIIGHWLLPTAGILFKKEIYNNYPDWTKKIYSGDLILLLLSMNQGRIFAFSDVCCVYRRDITNKSSVSINVRKTKSREFVRNQHILLYSEFNNYTEGKYNVYIQPLIERYADEAKVYKALNKSIIHGFICNPLVFFRIVYRSIKNI